MPDEHVAGILGMLRSILRFQPEKDSVCVDDDNDGSLNLENVKDKAIVSNELKYFNSSQ